MSWAEASHELLSTPTENLDHLDRSNGYELLNENTATISP